MPLDSPSNIFPSPMRNWRLSQVIYITDDHFHPDMIPLHEEALSILLEFYKSQDVEMSHPHLKSVVTVRCRIDDVSRKA
jgi:hypothetical protein